MTSDPVHRQRRSKTSVDVKDPLRLRGMPRFRRPSLGLPTEWSKRDPVFIGTFDLFKEWSKRDPGSGTFRGFGNRTGSQPDPSTLDRGGGGASRKNGRH